MRKIRFLLMGRAAVVPYLSVPSGRRGAEAGRPGEGAGVPLLPGSGEAGGGESQEGGLHREREESDQQEARARQPHRQSAGCPLNCDTLTGTLAVT